MAIEKVTAADGKDYYIDTDNPLYESSDGKIYKPILTNPDEKNPADMILIGRNIKISDSDEDSSLKQKIFLESTKVIKR